MVIGADWTLKTDDPIGAIYTGVTVESWQGIFPDSYITYRSLNLASNIENNMPLLDLWLDTSEEVIRGGNIDCEALIIRGDGDMLVSRMNMVELTERTKMGMLLNLPFAGHSSPEEQPEIFHWAFNKFMKAERPSVNS